MIDMLYFRARFPRMEIEDFEDEYDESLYEETDVDDTVLALSG